MSLLSCSEYLTYQNIFTVEFLRRSSRPFFLAHPFFAARSCTISSSSPLRGPLWWHNSFVSVQAFNRSPLTNQNENESLQSWRDWPCTPCRTNGQCSWAPQALLVILLAKSSKMMHPKSCGHRVTAYCWNRLLNRKMTMLFKQPTIVGLSTNWEDQLYVGVHFLADCLCSVLLKQRVLR